MYNILVVDDDKEIADSIKIYLEEEGYNVFECYDGEKAIEILKKKDIHLVLLDIMMPKIDGIAVAREIRKTNSVPIIFISAKSQSIDKIIGLNAGADDYITKPFEPLELIARVKSNIRRYTKLGNLIENKLLLFLASNKGQVFSIKQIYENVWKEPFDGYEKKVVVHISHIRDKIEINPKEPKYLKAVWGLGYKIENI